MKLKINQAYLVFASLLFLIELWITFNFKSGFIRHTFGDYLVVILLYTFIKGFTNLEVWTAAAIVLIIAFVIEFLQLTNVLAFLNLQDSYTAALLLGNSFQIGDLVAYTLGVMTVILLEKVYANYCR